MSEREAVENMPGGLLGRDGRGAAPNIGGALLRVGLALALVFGGLSAGLGYWQVLNAQELTNDPANPLVQAAARNAPRGRILDASGREVAVNVSADGDGDERRRAYPEPAMAPIVGYQSLIFGTSGLERRYDAELTGLAPLGPAGDVLRKFLTDPYDPSDVHLSVDLRLQEAATAALASQSGSIVAIEPQSGRVLAMASVPTFDANRIVDPEGGQSYLDTLNADPQAPLLNRATQGRFVPGSVFKIVTAIAGLGSGAIRPETTYETQPREYFDGFRVDGFRIRDSPRSFQTDEPLDFAEAVEVSSNIYFAHAGLDVGPEALVDWSSRMGFGSDLDFELATVPSQVNGGDGPMAGFSDRVELANAAYGQAETFVTPLQMALVASSVANDGLLMRPTLVDRLVAESGQTRTIGSSALRQVMSAGDADIITDAMVLAVEGEFGQFYTGGAQIPGVTTAGKSGTAELGDGPRPHSWFIGFAPAQAPRIAIAVIVERAGTGRDVAVPIGGDLMELYLDLIG